MEHAISSLAYKGSIVEAIAEAKRQKKLFVVYISGDNAESTQLEESIWIDSSVAESISKYCILLHISEGSTDATNFSVIYPQKSAPCITAIGYNGVNLWQNEGFVGADVLASSLEKAWLSLHIQETTATFLTAAFASKKSETHGTNSSETVSFEQGSSSSVDVLSPSTDKQAPYSEARVAVCSEMESKGSDHANEEINSKLGDAASPGSVLANTLEGSEVEQATSSIETTKESLRFVKVDHSAGGDLNVVDRHSEVTTETSQVIANEATETVQQKNSEVIENYKIDSEVTTVTSQVIANEATEAVQQKNSEAIENYKIDSEVTVVANKETEAVQDKKADAVDKDKIHVLESCLSKPTDVHLNIRLLDGANLQEKFLLTNTLRMVKDYVDGNQASAIGSYDLGIPYPRKVFTDQDLSETLAELGLVGRQALIIVPRHQVTGYYRGGSSSHNQKNSTTDLASSNGNNEGYLGLTKRILSYLNPFSYLGGGANSSNSAQESQDRLWQYGPNPALQNNQRGAGTTPSVYSSNQSDLVTGRNNNSSKKAPTSRLGSNIHTLKHDEDDGRFSERNAFWNGNSTEYGGDNDGK